MRCWSDAALSTWQGMTRAAHQCLQFPAGYFDVGVEMSPWQRLESHEVRDGHRNGKRNNQSTLRPGCGVVGR
jgi:hypothetical protein